MQVSTNINEWPGASSNFPRGTRRSSEKADGFDQSP